MFIFTLWFILLNDLNTLNHLKPIKKVILMLKNVLLHFRVINLGSWHSEEFLLKSGERNKAGLAPIFSIPTMFRGFCEIQKLLWYTKKTKTYLAFDVKMELPQRRVYVYTRKQGKKQNILISKYCHVVVAVLASAQLWKWTTSRRDFGASEVRYHFLCPGALHYASYSFS